MGVGIVIVILILVVLSLITMSLFFLLYSKNNIYHSDYEPILFFVDIDLKKWRIKKANSVLNDISSNSNMLVQKYFKDKFGDGWISISSFFKKLDKKNEEKIRKAIEFCIQNKSSIKFTQILKIKSLHNKNKTISYFLDLKFQYVNKSYIIVECKSRDKIKNEQITKKIISKKTLFEDNKKYKLFVGFSTNFEDQNSFFSFIKKIDSFLKVKNLKFYKSNSIVVATIGFNNYSYIKKVKNKIYRKFDRSIGKNTINNSFDGIAYVESQNIESEKDFSKIMTRISFSLIKSKVLRKPVVFNQKSIIFNEFEEFKEKIMKIHDLIEVNNINYKNISILSTKNNKEVYEYLVPSLEIQYDYWHEYILEMNDFDKKIQDKFAINILKSNIERHLKSLININDYLIETQFDLIKKNSKNFIYIIKRVNYKNVNDFINLLKLLEISKISYGLFIEDFDPQVLSIIGNTKPEIIILSNKFNSNFEKQIANNKLKIMNAIVLTESLNIQLLFSNIDKKNKNEIILLSKKEKLYTNNSLSLLI